MNDDKVKATAAGENLQEALVLRPEWEIKPKGLEAEESFVVQFSQLTTHTNNHTYSKWKTLFESKIKR